MKFEYTYDEIWKDLKFWKFNYINLFERKEIDLFKYISINHIQKDGNYILNDGEQFILKNYTNINVGLILERKMSL